MALSEQNVMMLILSVLFHYDVTLYKQIQPTPFSGSISMHSLGFRHFVDSYGSFIFDKKMGAGASYASFIHHFSRQCIFALVTMTIGSNGVK